MGQDKKTRQIFISYAEQDSAIAGQVGDALEKAGYSTWRYERDNVPTVSFIQQVADAINGAQAVVLLISASALRSPHIRAELFQAYEADKTIISLLLDIRYEKFQQMQPDWALMVGNTVRIPVNAKTLSSVVPQIIKGLQVKGIEPLQSEGDSQQKTLPHDKRYKKRRAIMATLLGAFIIAGVVFGVYIGWGSGSSSEESQQTAMPPPNAVPTTIATATGTVTTLTPTPSISPTAPATDTITPTPTTIQTPTPTPASGTEVLFTDDFSSESSGWETFADDYGAVFYSNGWLHVRDADSVQYLTRSNNKRYRYADMVLEVDTKLCSGSEERWHLVFCRRPDPLNGYCFAIGPYGTYTVTKYIDGEIVKLIESTRSAHINEGLNAVNRIRVECIDDNLSLTVNDHLLAEVTDNTFSEGYIGLGTDWFGQGEPAEVAFDNLVITPPKD